MNGYALCLGGQKHLIRTEPAREAGNLLAWCRLMSPSRFSPSTSNTMQTWLPFGPLWRKWSKKPIHMHQMSMTFTSWDMAQNVHAYHMSAARMVDISTNQSLQKLDLVERRLGISRSRLDNLERDVAVVPVGRRGVLALCRQCKRRPWRYARYVGAELRPRKRLQTETARRIRKRTRLTFHPWPARRC
jgi:hypothetical protein